MVVIMMGVTGAGKSLVGSLLAVELGWTFLEGDLFHLPQNVEKMRRGIPLSDQDREPWLDRICTELAAAERRGESVVLACSALKESYRKRLLRCSAARVVYLKGDYALIAGRLARRGGHFMNPTLLGSQFGTLEEPGEGALVVDAALPPKEIVQLIRRGLEV